MALKPNYVIFWIFCFWSWLVFLCVCVCTVCVWSYSQLLQKKEYEIMFESYIALNCFSCTQNAQKCFGVMRSNQKAQITAKASNPLRLNPWICTSWMGSSLAHCPDFNQGLLKCSQWPHLLRNRENIRLSENCSSISCIEYICWSYVNRFSQVK